MSNVNQHDFVLDLQLAGDTFPVASLRIGDVRLMNDARFVWCIVVPRIPGLRDWSDMPATHKIEFNDEIDKVCAAVQATPNCFKLNVASLGNVVEQLHVHIIARHPQDDAWPSPVWGRGEAVPYDEERLANVTRALQQALAESDR